MARWLSVLILALGCVASVRAGDEEEVQKRIDILKDADKSIASKKTAISELGKYGAKAEPALPVLEQFLFTPNTAEAATTTLGSIGKKGVPLLVKVIEAPYPYKLPLPRQTPAQQQTDANTAMANYADWKKAAVVALGAMGQDAASAVKPLLALLATADVQLPNRRSSSLVRVAALYPLGRIAGEDDAKVVATRLGEYLVEPGFAPEALRGLKSMGVRGKDAVPHLTAMIQKYLKKENGAVSSSEVTAAVTVLEALGPEAADALPTLRDLLKTGLFNNTEKAIEAIKAKK